MAATIYDPLCGVLPVRAYVPNDVSLRPGKIVPRQGHGGLAT